MHDPVRHARVHTEQQHTDQPPQGSRIEYVDETEQQHTEQTRDDLFVLAQMTVPLARTLAALVAPPAPAPAWPAREPVRARRAQPAPPDSAARALCARVAHIARLSCHKNTAALAALRLAAELAPPLVALALAPPAPGKGVGHIDRAAFRAALAPAALAPLLRRAALASATIDRAARARYDPGETSDSD